MAANNDSLSTPFGVIYAFGDSLSDAGNVSITTTLTGEEPVSPPYNSQSYGGISASEFSNGPVWVQDLSRDLGLGQLAPSLAGGTDFAFGGAEAGSEPQNSGNLTTQTLSVPSQLSQFGLGVGHASASALFTLSVGGNDIFDILGNVGLSTAQQASDVTAAVSNELSDVSRMYGDGMRNIVVLNVPNLGEVPDVTNGLVNNSSMPSAALDAQASSLSASYDSQLASGLSSLAATDGFNYQLVDTYGLISSAVADPGAYGYTNVTEPVWSGSFTNANDGTLSSTTPAVQNQSLFWDVFHPTESGHNDIANIADAQVAPAYVYEADLTTGALSFYQGQAYAGQDTNLITQFAAITPGNVALWASTPGTFLQAGTGNDILVAQSGTNALSAAGGSNYLESGTGSDSIYLGASGTMTTWSEVDNFHPSDALSIVGYDPGKSVALWTAPAGIDGAVLNVNVAGSGSIWTSVTFLGVSLGTAEGYATSSTTSGGLGVYNVTA